MPTRRRVTPDPTPPEPNVEEIDEQAEIAENEYVRMVLPHGWTSMPDLPEGSFAAFESEDGGSVLVKVGQHATLVDAAEKLRQMAADHASLLRKSFAACEVAELAHRPESPQLVDASCAYRVTARPARNVHIFARFAVTRGRALLGDGRRMQVFVQLEHTGDSPDSAVQRAILDAVVMAPSEAGEEEASAGATPPGDVERLLFAMKRDAKRAEIEKLLPKARWTWDSNEKLLEGKPKAWGDIHARFAFDRRGLQCVSLHTDAVASYDQFEAAFAAFAARLPSLQWGSRRRPWSPADVRSRLESEATPTGVRITVTGGPYIWTASANAYRDKRSREYSLRLFGLRDEPKAGPKRTRS